MEPKEIVAGTTVKWTKSLSDYPAGEGWSLIYYFFNANSSFSVEATASGNDFQITISANITANYTPGEYKWQAIVVKGDEKYVVDSGYVKILPNPTQAVDWRSEIKKALDAIKAVIEGRANKDQASYTIAGRRLDRTPIPDLIVLYDKLKKEFAKELKAEKLAKGESTGSKILIRFKG